MKVRLGRKVEFFWVDIKYGHLLDFCFFYGLIGHLVQECEVGEEWKKLEGYWFGNWLKAPFGQFLV